MYLPLCLIYFFIVLACVFTVSAQDYGYETCKKELDKIIDGNKTKNGVDRENYDQYLWKGNIAGFRGQQKPPLALGYEGKL